MVNSKRTLGNKCKWAPLEQPLANILGRYCRYIARNPWPFIIVPTILTIVLSSGIFCNFKIVRGVNYLYAPLNAEWKAEEDVFRRYWASTDDQFYPGKDILQRKGLYLMVEAIDKGNLLRPEFAEEFIRLIDWITSETFITVDEIKYTYRNICLQFQNQCFMNAHARFVAEIFSRKHQTKFNVTYPKFYSEFSSEPIDISKTLGGVTTDSNGNLLSATAWMVVYQFKHHGQLFSKLSSDFELAVASKIKNKKTPTKLLNIYYFHSNTFEVELAETNRQIAPSFALTFTILSIFSVLCTFNVDWMESEGKVIPVVDWVLSKPLMGIIGVIVTIMAIVSSMGLLLLFNVTFVDMATVMPFLSLSMFMQSESEVQFNLAVGIDDTFLMLAAWHETSRKLSVEDRIEAAMKHAAVSIGITSLTDAIAFIIGAIAPLPAVIYFCYYSSAAICFIFCYSLSIFVACLSIQGRWEEANRNSTLWIKTKPLSTIEECKRLEQMFNMGSRIERCLGTKSIIHHNKQTTDDRLWYQRFFEDIYAPFISHPLMQLFACLTFIAYVLIAIAGVQKITVGFDPVNIIQRDSPSRKFFEIRNRMFPEDVSKMDIAVLKPPNMGDPYQRNHFLQALAQFESTNCSQGRNSTDFWYFGYQKYLDELGFGNSWSSLNENEEEFNNNLKSFLLANDKYSHDILYYPNGTMKAFRFTTQLIKLPTDERVMDCARLIRNIARSHHDDYNMNTYTPLWVLADQFEIMWPQTLQDLYISIAVMVPISLLLIPQPLCAVIVALNIASIALGVIGFMSWWNVNLDATSMITIAMSVGFSVDFAAHITYGYMTEAKTKQMNEKNIFNMPYIRLVGALGAVGWPVTQASISVLIGIVTLSAVDSFIVQTCFKTVFLVVVFGTLHALLYLPLILMRFHHSYLWLRMLWKSKIRSTTVAPT
uniref:SSD domain-containing protein n=1 Tax=Syphacia muris TaxID=451379 RepID=A0A0N5ALF7_9BILA